MNCSRETALGFQISDFGSRISDLETGNPPEGWEAEGQIRTWSKSAVGGIHEMSGLNLHNNKEAMSCKTSVSGDIWIC